MATIRPGGAPRPTCATCQPTSAPAPCPPGVRPRRRSRPIPGRRVPGPTCRTQSSSGHDDPLRGDNPSHAFPAPRHRRRAVPHPCVRRSVPDRPARHLVTPVRRARPPAPPPTQAHGDVPGLSDFPHPARPGPAPCRLPMPAQAFTSTDGPCRYVPHPPRAVRQAKPRSSHAHISPTCQSGSLPRRARPRHRRLALPRPTQPPARRLPEPRPVRTKPPHWTIRAEPRLSPPRRARPLPCRLLSDKPARAISVQSDEPRTAHPEPRTAHPTTLTTRLAMPEPLPTSPPLHRLPNPNQANPARRRTRLSVPVPTSSARLRLT